MTIKTLKKNRGFTIVEMAIVLAIIAVIAAIVIVTAQTMIYKAKKLEAEIAIEKINAMLSLEIEKPTTKDDMLEIANKADVEDIYEIFSGDFSLGYNEDKNEDNFVLVEKDDNSDNVIIVIGNDTDGSSDTDDNDGENIGGGSEGGGDTDSKKDDDKKDDSSGGGDTKYDEDDTILNELKAESEKSETLFVRCDADGTANGSGNYVQFGYYPQGEVIIDTDAYKYLSETYCEKSDGGKYLKADGWKSLDYYISYVDTQKRTDVAWYLDVDIDKDSRPDYRGIYFTEYRSTLADGSVVDSTVANDARQYKNGYKIDTVYWFKYDPIIWQIAVNSGNEYVLLSKNIIDCGQYNDGSVNNFSSSGMATFLNGVFYSSAFSSGESAMVQAKSGTASGIYVMSKGETEKYQVVGKKTLTAYALCLGAGVQVKDTINCGYWWTRTLTDENKTTEYDEYAVNAVANGPYSYCFFIDTDGTEMAYGIASSETGYVPAVTVVGASS